MCFTEIMGFFRFTKKMPCYIFGEHARQLFFKEGNEGLYGYIRVIVVIINGYK